MVENIPLAVERDFDISAREAKRPDCYCGFKALMVQYSIEAPWRLGDDSCQSICMGNICLHFRFAYRGWAWREITHGFLGEYEWRGKKEEGERI